MRIFAFAALLATSLAATGCAETAGDAVSALSQAPTSFPATVEGTVYFDLAEAEIDEASLDSSMDVTAMLDIGQEDANSFSNLTVNIPGNLVKDAGLQGDGEKVRLTLSGKSDFNGMDLYRASALQKL